MLRVSILSSHVVWLADNRCLTSQLVVVDAHILAIVVLLPDGDLVVTSRHGKHVASERPAHMPCHAVELVEHIWLPNTQRATARATCSRRIIQVS